MGNTILDPMPAVPTSPQTLAKQSLVLDETIDDVDKSTIKLIFTKYLRTTLIIVASCIVWEFLMTYLIETGGPDDLKAFGLYIPVFIFVGSFIFFRIWVLGQFMKQFAKTNNLTFAQTGDTSQLQGALFKLGRSHLMTNVSSGSYDGNNFNLFDYQYTTGSGKSSHANNCTAAQIDYPTTLVPILLVVDSQFFGGIVPLFGNWEKIKPEGDFDKNFDLYTKKELEIEALQIFSPDFMLKILQDWPEFNLEFIGNKIIVFYNRTITKKNELQKMFDLIGYLITKIEPLAKRMESSLKALEQLQK